MAEQIAQGIEPAAAGVPAPQPVAQPVAQPQPVAQQPASQSAWGTQPVQNGFAQPQPIAQPVAQPEPQVALATDNDRTKQQFEKLTDTNQRLAQTNELLRQELIAVQQQRQQTQQQVAQQPSQQVQPGQQPSAMPKLTDYIEIDPATGERVVNETRFNAAMAEIYQKASRAEETVQNYVSVAEQRERDRNERETFSAYPQLNPRDGGFDQSLAQTVQAHLLNSMVNPQMYGGRAMSLKESADFVAQQVGGIRPAQIQAVPVPAVNEANQVQKEQAALSVPSVPQQVSQNVDTEREYQKLVQGTRLGSDEAIALRLKNSTHKMDDFERQGI